jgi:hypothetical protein
LVNPPNVTASRLARRSVIAFLTGLLLVGTAWAGIGLAPGHPSSDATSTLPVASAAAVDAAAKVGAPVVDPMQPPDLSGFTTQLPAGQFLVGAGIESLAPDPAKVQWDSGATPCIKEDQSLVDPGVSTLASAMANKQTLAGWPKSPNCVYLGGYGIGPSRPATGVDPYAGVHVRSIAISNGQDTIVWQVLDMVGFFARYRSDLCPQGCGMLDIREAIAGATANKVPVSNVVVAATHTHGGADGYGAWGGLPDWYRVQIRDQAIKSAYDALRNMKPAAISVGAVDARSFDNERRDTYFSAADYGAVWLQARQLPKKPQAKPSTPVVATLVNFAAHPTMLGDQTLMHSDWAGTFMKELGDLLGGEGLFIQGSLGNVSPGAPRGTSTDLTGDGQVDEYDNPVRMAKDLATFIGDDIARGGYTLSSNKLVAKTDTISHPATNPALVPAGLVNLLDREFLPGTPGADGPNAYTWDKDGLGNSPPGRGCATASPISVKVDISGFRIGELTVLTGPGELFGTMTEVVKSKARDGASRVDSANRVLPAGQTMVFAQAQDTLGYVIQHFEVDAAGGLTSNANMGEYEEEFMVDRCFGDHVLDTQLQLAGELR